MSKIKFTFEKLKELNKSALIPFITAGDPSPDDTVALMNTLVENGADMIELGILFQIQWQMGQLFKGLVSVRLK